MKSTLYLVMVVESSLDLLHFFGHPSNPTFPPFNIERLVRQSADVTLGEPESSYDMGAQKHESL